VRVLIHWNTTKSQKEIVHVYLGEAAKLRPDQIHLQEVNWGELEAWIAAQLAAFEQREEQAP